MSQAATGSRRAGVWERGDGMSKPTLAIATLASLIATTSPFDLILDGYSVLWSGNAVITGCVDSEDRYQFGPYSFSCDRGITSYPYRRGTVYLLAREQPGHATAGFLCINYRDGCFLGTIDQPMPVATD